MDQLVALAYQLLQQAAQHNPAAYKAVSSTATNLQGHGIGGLFSSPAMERPVVSAMLLPRHGLQARLPLRKNTSILPTFGIITGVTATTGSEPTGPCDDFPVAGFLKLCEQSAYFARQGRSSPVVEIDQIGRVTNRGEHLDFQMVGNPFGPASPNMAPTIPGGTPGNPLNDELSKLGFQLSAAWVRDFAREFYTGNPANNTSGGGRKYYRGLDLYLNTGQRDIYGNACAAADAIVASFSNLDIGSNGGQFVRLLTNIYRRLRIIAEETGMNPVKWVIAMAPTAFYELTEIWPCAYSTYRCATGQGFSASAPMFTDSQAMIAMRDEMRGDMDNYTGQYLLIDGQRVEVVLDPAINQDGTGGGTFTSSLYFVPLTVVGGTPVTYMEYFPYNEANGPEAFADSFGVGSSFKSSDDGRFLWHFKPPTNYCIQLQAKTEVRLILRTPYLGARVTGFRYTPLQMERSPFTDSTYFANGGSTQGVGPSFYTPTTSG